MDSTSSVCQEERRQNQNAHRLPAAECSHTYPLPRVEEMIEKASGATHITTLDLSTGYYQIPVASEDQCLQPLRENMNLAG